MEKAVFFRGREEDLSGFDRLYFGAEFCEHLLPSVKELERAVSAAVRLGKGFTLATPFVTDKGIRKTGKLIALLSRRMPSAEVVFNDFGVLGMINQKGLKPVMGRLLTKQKNDPRTVMLKGKIGRKAYDCFRRSNLELDEMQDFLLENDVGRVEIDNLLQGVRLPHMSRRISVSLHYPHVYISTTRLCMADSCTAIKDRLSIRLGGCARECSGREFRLRDRTFPAEIIMRGNTQFCRNGSRENFRLADRIVLEKPQNIYKQQVIKQAYVCKGSSEKSGGVHNKVQGDIRL